MTYSEWLEQNRWYVLLDDSGDIVAEVELPEHHTRANREHILSAMAWATSTKWSEKGQYNFEG
jgi:hypothetical protein